MKNVILIVLSMALSACSIVGPGERGIRFVEGKVSPEVVQPGMHIWFPVLYGLTTMDVQVQKSEVETSSASKDLQEITTKVAINWSLNPDSVTTIYSTIGNEYVIYDRVINPSVNEILNAASAKRTAEEVLTKRLEMKQDIDDMLRARLKTYGVNLLDVNIVNLTFSHDFMTAVEKKQIAEQRAKEAEYETQQAIQTAQKAINEAKGQAEAQRLLQKSITKDLLTLEFLKKWSGVLPQIMTGSSNMLFGVDLKSLGK